MNGSMDGWMGSSCFSAAYTVGTVLVITGNPNAGWGWGRGRGTQRTYHSYQGGASVDITATMPIYKRSLS